MKYRQPPLLCLLLLAAPLAGQGEGQTSQQPAAAQPAKEEAQQVDMDSLYEAGKALFDQYAPDDVKRDYEFPSKTQWDAFAVKLQKAMQGDSLADLAALEPEARQALLFLDTIPQGADLADWLRERLDMIEAAKALQKTLGAQTPAKTPPSPVEMPRPSEKPAEPVAKAQAIPSYDFWLGEMKRRPAPRRAAVLMPTLREAFDAEGVPASLAWLAEVESTMNPHAESPAGAKGLFQLMPDTAKGLGLSTWMPDERIDPKKSARAVARHLRDLYNRFGEWPLALAAYNSGEGRVRRTLDKAKGKTFVDISSALPVETRLYVPKVLATVNTRTGVAPERLPPPSI